MGGVEDLAGLPGSAPRPLRLDRQGWFTIGRGTLLRLISFTTDFGDANLLGFSALQVAHQNAMALLLATLAALAGDS